MKGGYGMGRIKQIVGCVGVCAALASFPARANAISIDAGSAWAGPTRLESGLLGAGNRRGAVFASRVGIGPNTTSVCVEFRHQRERRDGTFEVESASGCRFDAPLRAYEFQPLRWKAAVAVSVPVERWTSVERADHTVVSASPVTLGRARVELRWTGVGDTRVSHDVGTAPLALPGVYADINATRDATVRGTLRIGDVVIAGASAAGMMQQG